MQTMQPVVGLGSYRWDPEWLPLDEFEERLRTVRRAMAERGWDGLIVHGNNPDSAALTYLTNYYPRNRWAVGLVPAAGPLKLLFAGSTRDLPAAALLTWVRDVASYGEAAKILPGWIGGLAKDGRKPRVAVAGEKFMRRAIHDTVVGTSAKHADLDDADDVLAAMMRRKRPREMSMIRKSCAILADTVAALKREKAKGAPAVAATVEAERVARGTGAQDIRILFSLDSGRTLRPFEELSDVRCDPLVAYVAVRYLGYWSEAMVTLADAPSAARESAAAALDRLISAAKPGAAARDLARLAPAAMHPLLGGKVGHAIGLLLDEAPALGPDGDAVLEPGEVYSLQAGVSEPAGHALVSAMVAVGEEDAQVLYRA